MLKEGVFYLSRLDRILYQEWTNCGIAASLAAVEKSLDRSSERSFKLLHLNVPIRTFRGRGTLNKSLGDRAYSSRIGHAMKGMVHEDSALGDQAASVVGEKSESAFSTASAIPGISHVPSRLCLAARGIT